MDKVKNILEIDSVILEFGTKRILQDVYLKCEANKITGLLGRNGAGKSCLMNIIYGKLIPLNGMVRVNSNALLRQSRKPSDIMFLPQFGFVPKYLTLRRVFQDFKLELTSFFDEFPEFAKYCNMKIGLLSGGERRIIEIYVVLASESKFCLLDEPFSHIMPVHIEKIKNLIKKVSKNKGIVITDHLYKHIVDICNDIYLIKDGKTHLIKHLQEVELLGYVNSLL